MINNQEDMKKVFVERKHEIEIFQHAVINKDKLAEVKKILMDEIHKQEESEKSENSSSTTKFDPKKFWNNWS